MYLCQLFLAESLYTSRTNPCTGSYRVRVDITNLALSIRKYWATSAFGLRVLEDRSMVVVPLKAWGAKFMSGVFLAILARLKLSFFSPSCLDLACLRIVSFLLLKFCWYFFYRLVVGRRILLEFIQRMISLVFLRRRDILLVWYVLSYIVEGLYVWAYRWSSYRVPSLLTRLLDVRIPMPVLNAFVQRLFNR